MAEMSDSLPRAKRPLFKDPATAVTAIVFLGYVLIARVVLDIFPFSTYTMYASGPGGRGDEPVRGCHLLAVGPDGIASDVSDFRAWDCPVTWEGDARKAAVELGCSLHNNVEDPIREHVRKNSAKDPAAVKVDLIRRVWEFAPRKPTRVSDHFILSCRGVPR